MLLKNVFRSPKNNADNRHVRDEPQRRLLHD